MFGEVGYLDGTMLIDGLPLGVAEIGGLSDGMEDGWADTLGDSDGIDDGTPVLVGLVLGGLDG